MEPALAGPWMCFPPGSRGHLLLPVRPRAAAVQSLELYAASERHQRVGLAAGRLIVRGGFKRLLHQVHVLPWVDVAWWAQLLREVAEPRVGPLAAVAFLLVERRVNALLLAGSGQPVGFVKARQSADPELYRSTLEPRLLTAVAGPLTRAFRAPALLAHGDFGGWHYQLLEPLPAGRHRNPPHDPPRIAAVVDELQERGGSLPVPAGVPDGHVPCHGDLTPRNVRVTADGEWWLFDWEYARWGPRLADELRYWTTELAIRGPRRPRHAAARLHELLQSRGSDAEIAEALGWRQHVTAAEEAICRDLARLLGSPARVAEARQPGRWVRATRQ